MEITKNKNDNDNPANYGDKAIRAASQGEMNVCLVITKEVIQK